MIAGCRLPFRTDVPLDPMVLRLPNARAMLALRSLTLLRTGAHGPPSFLIPDEPSVA